MKIVNDFADRKLNWIIEVIENSLYNNLFKLQIEIDYYSLTSHI